MDRDEIIDGEICDGCGVPIFFYGEQTADCPPYVRTALAKTAFN